MKLKFPNSVMISGDIVHKCGQYLQYYMHINNDDEPFPTEAKVIEARFTLTASFCSPLLHFKAHGSRVKKCPTCSQQLPAMLENVNDDDFLIEHLQLLEHVE